MPGAALAGPRDVQVVAFSSSGETALVLETAQSPGGGQVVSYRVVGPGVLQERHVVSNELSVGGGPLLQRVSAEGCREALRALKKVLKATRFQGVELRGDECARERLDVVLVSEELAAKAEQAELDTDGETWFSGDWQIRLEKSELVLQSPGATKRLKLPRAVASQAAHVLLSPTRRLLLLLASTQTGEQVLVAGFASKTGQLADFQ